MVNKVCDGVCGKPLPEYSHKRFVHVDENGKRHELCGGCMSHLQIVCATGEVILYDMDKQKLLKTLCNPVRKYTPPPSEPQETSAFW